MERLVALYRAASSCPTGSTAPVIACNSTVALASSPTYPNSLNYDTLFPDAILGSYQSQPTSRAVYDMSAVGLPTTSDIVTSTSSTFFVNSSTIDKAVTPAVIPQVINDVYKLVYVYQVSSGNFRNIVWLDPYTGIVGQLSWTLTDIVYKNGTGSGIPTPCYSSSGSNSCKLLTLYLDYPFRANSETSPPYAPLNSGKPLETITLQTIVGARP